MTDGGGLRRLVIDVHDRPGVLARIASLFYRRGLNIRRLWVDPLAEPERSRLVVQVAAGAAEVQRLALALGNLVDVLSVRTDPT